MYKWVGHVILYTYRTYSPATKQISSTQSCVDIRRAEHVTAAIWVEYGQIDTASRARQTATWWKNIAYYKLKVKCAMNFLSESLPQMTTGSSYFLSIFIPPPPPSFEKGGHIALTCPSVCRSIGMLVSFNFVQLITQEHFAPEASNLVGR